MKKIWVQNALKGMLMSALGLIVTVLVTASGIMGHETWYLVILYEILPSLVIAPIAAMVTAKLWTNPIAPYLAALIVIAIPWAVHLYWLIRWHQM